MNFKCKGKKQTKRKQKLTKKYQIDAKKWKKDCNNA